MKINKIANRVRFCIVFILSIMVIQGVQAQQSTSVTATATTTINEPSETLNLNTSLNRDEIIANISSEESERIHQGLEHAFQILETTSAPLIWAAIQTRLEDEAYRLEVIEYIKPLVIQQIRIPDSIMQLLRRFILEERAQTALPCIDILIHTHSEIMHQFVIAQLWSDEVESIIKNAIIEQIGALEAGKGQDANILFVQNLVSLSFHSQSIPMLLRIIESLRTIGHACALTALHHLKQSTFNRIQTLAEEAYQTMMDTLNVDYLENYTQCSDCVIQENMAPEILNGLQPLPTPEALNELEQMDGAENENGVDYGVDNGVGNGEDEEETPTDHLLQYYPDRSYRIYRKIIIRWMRNVTYCEPFSLIGTQII